MTNKADCIAGCGIAVLAGLVYSGASRFPAAAKGLGAGGFPKFIAVCLGILGVILAVKSFLQMRRNSGRDQRVLRRNDLLGAGALVVLFYLYILLVRPLGYMVSTTLFFFLFMVIYGERKWLRMCIISVSFSVIAFFLFKNVFYIMLPQGTLF